MSLPFVIIFALMVSVGQHFVYQRWSLRRLSYAREFNVEACREGEQVEMVERIASDKWLPLPWLRLEALLSASLRFVRQDSLAVSTGEQFQNHRSFFTLRPYTAIVRRHKVLCTRRGCYDMNTATLTCGDLFGFGTSVQTFNVGVRLLVYPNPAPLPELPLPWRGWQGDFAVRRWIVEDPFLLQGVREYRPGDDLRSVHWKATARSGELQVHNRGFTSDRHLMVLLNLEVHEGMWGPVTEPELIEWGIRCSLTLIQECLADGAPVGFGCNGYSVDEPRKPIRLAPGGGEAQHRLILEQMAKLELDLYCRFHDLLDREMEAGGEPADLVLITAFVTDKLRDRIRVLEESGRKVAVLPLEHKEQGPGQQRTVIGNG